MHLACCMASFKKIANNDAVGVLTTNERSSHTFYFFRSKALVLIQCKQKRKFTRGWEKVKNSQKGTERVQSK
jgi:hypothetical protein